MKLRLTESQLKRLQENIDKEDNKYRKEVTATFYAVSYKGFEVNDIVSPKISLSYDIDIEARSWGIKNMSLHGIQGPSEIDIEVSYYPNGDDSHEEPVSIHIDWHKAHIEENTGTGELSVGNEVEIHLDPSFNVVKIVVQVDKF